MLKNLILIPPALMVAGLGYAGAAKADSHIDFSLPVDFEFGLNDLAENGLYLSGDIDMIAKIQLGDNLKLKLSVDGDLLGFDKAVNWDDFITYELRWGDVKFSAGNVDSAAGDIFSSVSGMSLNNSAVSGDEIDFFKQNGEYIVRFDADIGDVSLAISGDSPSDSVRGPIENPSIGVSGSIGDFDFAVAYDALGDRDTSTVFGADIAFPAGDFDIEMAYQKDGEGDTAFGIAVDGSLGSVGVAAYFANNSSAWNAYGASASATLGEVDAGIYWSGSDSGYSNFGIDMQFDLAENIKTYIGVDQGDGVYFGAILKTGDDIKIGLSIAQDAGGQKHGPKDFMDGLSLWFSSSF